MGAGRLGGLPDAPAAVVEWLGWANLALVALNALPALPLDGGRILRALLWRLSGSRLRATRAATPVSRVVAVLLVAAEHVPERRRAWVTVRELLADSPGGFWLEAEEELRSALELLVTSPLHRAAVLRAGRLVGLVSLST